MKQKILVLVAMIAFQININAQCSGLQIVGFSSDDPDQVLLKATADIPGSMVFWLTDNEWVSGTNSFADLNEDEVSYTTPVNGLASGSTILLEGSSATCGSLSGTILGLSFSNTENIYLLDVVPSTTTNMALPINFCFSITFGSGTGGGDLPPTNSVDVGNVDNAVYTSGAITNPASWSGSNSPLSTPLTGTCTSLAVKIKDYRLQNNGHSIVLTWTTTEEKDHSHFMVERSSDGIHFITIGKVEASLGRSGNKDYAYNDETPNEGINYYRLVQYDLDGTKTTFDILSSIYKGHGEKFLYPSIASSQIFLSGCEDGVISVFDASGRKVLHTMYSRGGGVDVTSLKKGIYFTIIGNDRFKFEKL